MQTVLVTGAAGTVGNYVVGLLEADGYAVVANDVTPAGLRKPTRGRLCPGDLTDPYVRERALEGVDRVIHTAGLLDPTVDAAALGRVNTELVADLYEASRARAVKRFIHMSTCMLYASGQDRTLDEDAATAPRGPHGLSKLGAEAYLRGRAQSEGPAWTILRAAPIYGRRGRHFAASLLAVGPILRLASPVLPRLSGGKRASFVHAEDVARALLFALGEPRTAHGVFNVADDNPLTMGERLEATFNAYGLHSFGSARLAGSLLGWLERGLSSPAMHDTADAFLLSAWRAVMVRHGLRPGLRPRLNREALTLLTDDLVIDSSRLRALGWAPRHGGFARGFAEVLRWYQAEAWVPRY